jgi:hypothetical protein
VVIEPMTCCTDQVGGFYGLSSSETTYRFGCLLETWNMYRGVVGPSKNLRKQHDGAEEYYAV